MNALDGSLNLTLAREGTDILQEKERQTERERELDRDTKSTREKE